MNTPTLHELHEELDGLAAAYDRKVAQRRRLLDYYDQCPDGDRRKYDSEQELKFLSARILVLENKMSIIADQIDERENA